MTDFVKSQAAMTSKERVQNMRRRKEDVTIRYKNGNANVMVVDDSTSSSTSDSFSVSESLEEERVQGERKPPLKARISPPLLPANVPTRAESPPNVFRVYQQNIGVLTPIIVEALREAEKSDGQEWICAAIGEAVKNNVRTWRYIETILERWRREGLHSDNRVADTGGRGRPGGGISNDQSRAWMEAGREGEQK